MQIFHYLLLFPKKVIERKKRLKDLHTIEENKLNKKWPLKDKKRERDSEYLNYNPDVPCIEKLIWKRVEQFIFNYDWNEKWFKELLYAKNQKVNPDWLYDMIMRQNFILSVLLISWMVM